MTSEHTPQQVLHEAATGLPAEDVAAVHAYAGAFCGRPVTAAELAGEVLAGQQAPAARPALLADVRRTAFGWLRDNRSGLLLPGFRDWAERAGETFGTADTLRLVEHSAPLLRAFGELPDQSRAALWLCLAEGEPAFAARVLHTSREFAESMAESARSRLADTYLRLRAEHTADARCVHYGGMLGAIARGTHRETPADLEQHLETCEFCAHDIALLRTLTSGVGAERDPVPVEAGVGEPCRESGWRRLSGEPAVQGQGDVPARGGEDGDLDGREVESVAAVRQAQLLGGHVLDEHRHGQHRLAGLQVQGEAAEVESVDEAAQRGPPRVQAAGEAEQHDDTGEFTGAGVECRRTAGRSHSHRVPSRATEPIPEPRHAQTAPDGRPARPGAFGFTRASRPV
jgi:hypothetical protein